MFHMKFRMGRLVAAAAVAVILTGGAFSSASARAKIDDLSSTGAQCRAYQSRADALLGEYAQPGTTDARRGQILAELRSIGAGWDSLCKSTYGNITLQPPTPTPVGRTVGPIADPGVTR